MTELNVSWPDDWVRAFVACPACGEARLRRVENGAVCGPCSRQIDIDDRGVLLALPERPPATGTGAVGTRDRLSQVSDVVKRFYEEHPFPNYDGFESVGDLLARASRSIYAAMLDRQIPIGARVLEIGCGTGQLGAFLSVGGRAVVGVDMSSASLRLASDFKHRHRLENLNFVQGDLFALPLQSESFDLVIAKGVLHHTADARRAFRAACRMLRPGGYFLVGLYNRVGRIPTSLRRWYFKLRRGGNASDYVLRQIAQSDDKAQSWFFDQYLHPHETRHTIDEVLSWFDENDLEYLNAVPPIRLGPGFDPAMRLFERTDTGSRLEHWLIQASWIGTISREGALFDMIGRRRFAGDPAAAAAN
jgi:SAM-dependent methyltransferase